jgi:hypothetical protein
MRFFFFILRILYSILGNFFASSLTSTSSPLTFLSSQFLFSFQSDLIRIFHISNCHHDHIILNFISLSIHVSGDLFIITLVMTFSDFDPVKFLYVFFHCHPLLSKIMHSSKHINLVISRYKFGFHLRDHPLPTFDSLFSFAISISLQFIPPQCFMPLQSSDNMFYFLIFFDIFIVEVFV